MVVAPWKEGALPCGDWFLWYKTIILTETTLSLQEAIWG